MALTTPSRVLSILNKPDRKGRISTPDVARPAVTEFHDNFDITRLNLFTECSVG
jgi:hypothetical protein